MAVSNKKDKVTRTLKPILYTLPDALHATTTYTLQKQFSSYFKEEGSLQSLVCLGNQGMIHWFDLNMYLSTSQQGPHLI